MTSRNDADHPAHSGHAGGLLLKMKGNRMKERIKLSLQEELERETEELKKEIERHPELADIQVDEEMDAAFSARIRALEKALKEERLKEERMEAERLMDEAEFAEERMPETEHLKTERAETGNSKSEHTRTLSANGVAADEGRKPVTRRRGKRRRALVLGLAAVLVLIMGMSITAVGSKSYFKVWWERLNGEGVNPTKILNVDDMDTMSSEDGEETLAYKKVRDELGIYVVRITNKPEGMALEDVQVDESMGQARFFYRYGKEIVRYDMYVNDNDSSWSEEEEDTLVKEYELTVKDVDITIKEYKVKKHKEYRRIAEFVYRDIHYQLKGEMKKDEFEEILKNLHFF